MLDSKPFLPPRSARKLCSLLGLAMLAFASLSQQAWSQTWAPNETQASAESDLIDPEFDWSTGRVAWNDCCGSLWVASVDMNTGLFVPADGKGVLVDPDSMNFQDAQKTKNGPAWAFSAGGDIILYQKYQGKHTKGNSRLGAAFPLTPGASCTYVSADGQWCAGNLGPNTVREAPYGSWVDNDPTPFMTDVDNKGNHYWRYVKDGSSEQPIPDFPPSNYPIRLPLCSDPNVPGIRSLIYPVTINGVQQVVQRDLNTGQVTQLTFDAGTKYQMYEWCAPEFNNELVFFTLVNNNELRVYRQLPDGNGSRVWTVIYDQFAPSGDQMFEPHPMVYNGHSYINFDMQVPQHQYRTEIWISNIDASAPIFKRITPTTPLMTRTDPKWLVTNRGLLVYFNELQPGCRDPSCSVGFWFADPGLPVPAPAAAKSEIAARH